MLCGMGTDALRRGRSFQVTNRIAAIIGTAVLIVVARYACKLLGIDYDTVVVNALIYCEILRAIKEGDR